MTAIRIDGTRGGLSRRHLEQVVRVLEAQGAIAYPTDSVYALGCAIGARQGMEAIYRARQMKERHRLAVLCSNLSMASAYAHLSQVGFRLVRRLFPGPYTVILPATSEVPRLLLERRRRRVGIRIPDHPIPLAIIEALGRPLLTSSAIAPGADEALADADAVAEAFGRDLEIVVDGGETGVMPTTVLELDDRDQLVVIRDGCGSLDAVEL